MVEYYKELLGRKATKRIKALKSFMSNGVKLTSSQQIGLVQEFTAEDVKWTIFSIDKNKSPVQNGYGSDFYRAAWSIVGKDII